MEKSPINNKSEIEITQTLIKGVIEREHNNREETSFKRNDFNDLLMFLLNHSTLGENFNYTTFPGILMDEQQLILYIGGSDDEEVKHVIIKNRWEEGLESLHFSFDTKERLYPTERYIDNPSYTPLTFKSK